MAEPNWNKINAKKRKEIMLGQAMNQAITICKDSHPENLWEKHKLDERSDEEILKLLDSWGKTYRDLAKTLFIHNMLIYDEVMKDGN
ncbi:MAG: hypothetical protein Unbinned1693contig1002_28 [Prokaryotic dsDNA virus sp.]|jgi:hypothetical protein|nr:MAG: hypothetical protein Unbinned1693contig1002_28 [Prokaryotic dsDNA virus sp.]|tara:strand:+ start:6682 stop:6942 length:261 start_codon:yes stop_codon:yes gene_type:complete